MTTPQSKLFSDTHDLARLRARLDQMLSAPASVLPTIVVAPQPMTARQRFAHWRTRLGSLSALVGRVPGLRDIVRLVWALLTIQGRLFQLRVYLDSLGSTLGQIEQQQRDTRRDLDAFEQLQSRKLAAAQHESQFFRRELQLVQARMERLASRIEGPTPEPDARAPIAGRDAWYLDFEQAHRGSSEEIARSQRVYLPFVHEVIADSADRQVLDLGCGQGEWLALLREEGISALGVDSNHAAVTSARQQGLRVHQDDLIDYLTRTDSQSVAAITAFQVVEHLDLDTLLSLFEQARRVLRPGGLMILETPNPENLQVSGYSFWLDPTHQRPLPPPLLFQLAQHFGFIDLHIERVNPWPEHQRLAEQPDDQTLERLRKLLYCEQDYALIARTPLVAETAIDQPAAA